MWLHQTLRQPGLHALSVNRRCDFGFSKDTVGQSTGKSSCGTPEYIAPELLFQGKYDGTRADTWFAPWPPLHPLTYTRTTAAEALARCAIGSTRRARSPAGCRPVLPASLCPASAATPSGKPLSAERLPPAPCRSCGVSLYVLLTGRFPFSWPGDADLAASNVKRMQKMFARITAGDYIPVPEVREDSRTAGVALGRASDCKPGVD